ncbi:MAG: M15 family metallopeptidase [Candidatus Paracaedibacteraceae bacterium]|nr:M15 family metallopeptidase [Candidatus Paracaedibacteraceae bacterium]
MPHEKFFYVEHIPCDIRYATINNFVGRPISGYLANKCVVSMEVYKALNIAQATANKKGLSLMIFEAYRPLKALEDILQWSKTTDTSTKERFYPTLEKTSLFDLGYIALRSTHTRGAAIDVTLIDPNTKQELGMGTEFDFFGELSHTASPNISAEAKANRRCLLEIMEPAGFINYEKEWWHFTLKDEPFPNCYFDFDIN